MQPASLATLLALSLAAGSLARAQLPADSAARRDGMRADPGAQQDSRRAQIYRTPSGPDFAFTRPRPAQFLRNVPTDFSRAWGASMNRGQVGRWALLTGGTLAMIAADQPIVDEAQRFGRRIGLSKDHDQAVIFTVPNPLGGKGFAVKGPTTFSSTLYFLGDGWSSVITAGSFLTFGAFAHDYRAMRTSSEVMEALVGVGIVAQVLKHTAGRQTPSSATVSGGKWQPLPSLKAYGDNVPNYDAFPSGHLATVMSTVTIVALNYPEKRWIRPIGYSVMTVLSFTMMNNGVHWVSDYPLAIAIGDTFGRIAVDHGRTAVPRENRDGQGNARHGVLGPFELAPHVGLGGAGMGLALRF
jgi:hypothetical protein